MPWNSNYNPLYAEFPSKTLRDSTMVDEVLQPVCSYSVTEREVFVVCLRQTGAGTVI